ncbi:hypothetical protein [Micromonospora tarensis]|uniref:Uncharacterized protein n=1 Tax=Micromonospora tarensis TaxID=2806100 RepID=A0ABS1YGW5_9ACTN|nr:hypothetical protein [Micromonospora tarensis]MBM0276641.1 hypothetical protein [Micromonospora tarensis]
MKNDVSVTALRSVREIGEQVWNGLAEGEGFYSGYPWMAWAETDPSFVTTYLVARDATGAPWRRWRPTSGPARACRR